MHHTLDNFLILKDRLGLSWEIPGNTFLKKVVKKRTSILLRCAFCGHNFYVAWVNLVSGKTRCCRPCSKMPDFDDLDKRLIEIGATWKTYRPIRYRSNGKRRSFLMTCSCGRKRYVFLGNVRNGKSMCCKSCSSSRVKHRLLNHPLYVKWRKMNGIGGRESVWDNFLDFYNWALPQWSPEMFLSRIDKSKKYGPENVTFKLRKVKEKDINAVIRLPRGISSNVNAGFLYK